MAAWVVITEADLLATKLAPLMSLLRSVALADGQADPVVKITITVVDRIRRKIAAWTANKVDANPATIPASLMDLACRMIVRAAKDRLELELTDTEREAWRVDERELDKIAAGDLPIEVPESAVPPPVQAVQPGPTLSANRRRFGRDDQEGA